MKTSNFIHITGSLIVIISALLMISHMLPMNTGHALNILGFLVWTTGQSMKINLLKKEIKELRTGIIT